MKKHNNDKASPMIRFKPITENQKIYYDSVLKNKITLVNGPAGSGKSFIPTMYAVKLLLEKKIDKFIISRPIIESGKEIGFLPGKYEDKLAPYVQPVLDIIESYGTITRQQYLDLMSQRRIETLPINFMRGRTFANTFILLDEMQNATYDQIVLALTRFGKNSIMVIDGDMDQSDLPQTLQGGLTRIANKLVNTPDIGIVKLEKCDIVREPIVATILEKLA